MFKVNNNNNLYGWFDRGSQFKIFSNVKNRKILSKNCSVSKFFSQTKSDLKTNYIKIQRAYTSLTFGCPHPEYYHSVLLLVYLSIASLTDCSQKVPLFELEIPTRFFIDFFFWGGCKL